MKEEMFENFISLGGMCTVAAALSKNGLRSTSGPFDWLISPLESVITLLENDFRDFIEKENLIIDKERDRSFYDKLELMDKFDFNPSIIRVEEFLAKGKEIDPYF